MTGSGTSADPYIIESWADLSNVTLTAGVYWELGTDLGPDSPGYDTYAGPLANGGAGWNPIGQQSQEFAGHFNGAGHSLSFYIYRPSTVYVALFAYIASTGSAKNLRLVDIDVTGGERSAGFAAYILGPVDSIGVSGSVTGNNYCGLLCGLMERTTISNCYATGSVTSGFRAGLITSGSTYGDIDNCWASGHASAPDAAGVVAYGYGTGSTYCYHNITISNYGSDIYFADRITAEMTGDPYPANVYDTWDMATIWTPHVDFIEDMAGNTGYPVPTVIVSATSGTEINPYVITSWADLDDVRNHTNDSGVYFELGVDLDSNSTGYSTYASSSANGGLGWRPIGEVTSGGTIDTFTGHFDGDGHTISDLYIDRGQNSGQSNYCGLFSRIDGATIQNLGIVNPDITGGLYTGAITGGTGGSANVLIQQCFVSLGTVSVTAESYDSFLMSRTGGIVGDLSGGSSGADDKIINCYSTAQVTGDDDIGGIVGYAGKYTQVTNVYSTGNCVIGYTYNSPIYVYWNTITSGDADSANEEGDGRTTTQMINEPYDTNTYETWDFTNIWWAYTDIVTDHAGNSGYPAFQWQSESSTESSGGEIIKIFPWMPRTGLLETLSWLTDIRQVYSGIEQRAGARVAPRQEFDGEYIATTMTQRMLLESLLSGWHINDFYYPIWPQIKSIGVISSGDTSITVDTTDCEYTNGGYLALWEDYNTNEVLEINTVNTGSIDLVDSVVQDYASAKAMPAKVSRIMGNPSYKDMTSTGAGIFNIKFQVNENILVNYNSSDADPMDSASDTDKYKGYDTLLDSYYLPGKFVERGIVRPKEIIDYDTGKVEVFSGMSYSRRTTKEARFYYTNLTDAYSFRDWLYRRAGKLHPVWIPTFSKDINIASSFTSTDTALTITNIGYTSYLFSNPIYRNIAFFKADGTILLREVTGASSGITNEQITIDSALGFDGDMNSFDKVSFLILYRLDTDRVEIKWHEAGRMESRIPLIGLDYND